MEGAGPRLEAGGVPVQLRVGGQALAHRSCGAKGACNVSGVFDPDFTAGEAVAMVVLILGPVVVFAALVWAGVLP
jgi:hypothetical protein